MAKAKCGYCKDCEEGNGPIHDSGSMEKLAAIEVETSCGCGKTVRHLVFRCTRCSKYYISSYYEHRYPHSDDVLIKLIDKAEADRIIAQIHECKTPEDPECKCEIHRKSEHLGSEAKGEQKYSKSYPND